MPAPDLWLNYPLYVPNTLPRIRAILAGGPIESLRSELEKLASLGNDDAGSILGYLVFVGAWSGQADAVGARPIVTGPANRGNPYAQYVLGLIEVSESNMEVAFDWWGKAIQARFSPAAVESGRYFGKLIAGRRANPKAARQVLRAAYAMGNVHGQYLENELRVVGAFGQMERLIGKLRKPVLLRRLASRFASQPFELGTFLHYPNRKRAFFSSPDSKSPVVSE